MASYFGQEGQAGQSAGSRGNGYGLQGGAGRSSKNGGGSVGKKRERSNSGGHPGVSSGKKGKSDDDINRTRFLCVNCLRENRDEEIKTYVCYNSLRKHQGRIHNVWCSTTRPYCGACGQGFEGSIPDGHYTDECGEEGQEERWKDQPRLDERQKRADMFATAGSPQIQRELVLRPGQLYHDTSAERQRRWRAVARVWAGGAFATGSAAPMQGLATQQYPQPAVNSHAGLQQLVPASQNLVAATGSWMRPLLPQQHPQSQRAGFQGAAARPVDGWMPNALRMNQYGNFFEQQQNASFPSTAANYHQFEGYIPRGGLEYGAGGSLSAQMGPARQEPSEQRGPPGPQGQMPGGYSGFDIRGTDEIGLAQQQQHPSGTRHRTTRSQSFFLPSSLSQGAGMQRSESFPPRPFGLQRQQEYESRQLDRSTSVIGWLDTLHTPGYGGQDDAGPAHLSGDAADLYDQARGYAAAAAPVPEMQQPLALDPFQAGTYGDPYWGNGDNMPVPATASGTSSGQRRTPQVPSHQGSENGVPSTTEPSAAEIQRRIDQDYADFIRDSESGDGL